MRRFLISSVTATALALGALGGAATANAQSLEETVGSVTESVSSAVTDPQGTSDQAQEELPSFLTQGSSGAEQMSAADGSSASWVNGSSQVAIDWVIGAVLITAVGQVIQVVFENFF